MNKFLKSIILTGISLAIFLPIFQIDLLASDISQHALRVFKIDTLAQMSDSQPPQTIYFFDIDDTLFDSPTMLGSKAWRKYVAAATTKNWHDFFTLFVARNHPVAPVENITSKYILHLQMKEHAVFGLTSRERNKWYDTPTNDVDGLSIGQLDSIGVRFNHEVLNLLYPYITNAPEYFEGVFFADIEPKGQYLLKLFKDASILPEKVVFIDDKLSQVESVAAALDELGIDYECYWYTATDKKASCFDPLVADIQFFHLWEYNEVLSDKEASLIADQFSDRENLWSLLPAAYR